MENGQPTQAGQTGSQPETPWQYNAGDSAPDTPGSSTPPPPAKQSVSWTASEYIAHDKGFGWYVVLGLVIAAGSLAIYFLTQELISTIVMVIIGLSFGAFAARQPQELRYTVDNRGIHIGQKTYGYGQFKSFSLIEEEAVKSIMLMPLQRFALPISVYYDPEDEEKIFNAISSYLPYEQRRQDWVDRLMRKIRF